MPVAVAEHLHLDVAGVGDQPLEEHRRVAERLRGSAASPASTVAGSSAGSVHGQHADAAAAGDALHQQREADRAGGGHRGVDVDERRRPRRQRDARGRGRGAGLVLGAEAPDLLGRRAR